MPRGRVRHALVSPTMGEALCGFGVRAATGWLGTGSQAEYERLAELPVCRSCVLAAARIRAMVSGERSRARG